jgi:hypothetical protein
MLIGNRDYDQGYCGQFRDTNIEGFGRFWKERGIDIARRIS